MFNSNTPLRLLVVFGFFIALTACGGGGGGSSASSSATPASVVFPVAQSYASFVMNGTQVTLKITGKVSGVSITGTSSYTLSPAFAATFEGHAGLANTETFSGTITGNGHSAPVNISDTLYADSNYNSIGSVGSNGEYTVVDTYSIPTQVHVNDAGTLGTATEYSNQTKTSTLGTAVATYKIESDSATSIIFAVTTRFYDYPSHTLTETQIERLRVTDTGAISFVSIQTTTSDNDSLLFVAQ